MSANHQKTKVSVVNLLSLFEANGLKFFGEKGKANTGIKSCVQPQKLCLSISHVQANDVQHSQCWL